MIPSSTGDDIISGNTVRDPATRKVTNVVPMPSMTYSDAHHNQQHFHQANVDPRFICAQDGNGFHGHRVPAVQQQQQHLSHHDWPAQDSDYGEETSDDEDEIDDSASDVPFANHYNFTPVVDTDFFNTTRLDSDHLNANAPHAPLPEEHRPEFLGVALDFIATGKQHVDRAPGRLVLATQVAARQDELLRHHCPEVIIDDEVSSNSDTEDSTTKPYCRRAGAKPLPAVEVVFECLVQPRIPITSHLTPLSGISPAALPFFDNVAADINEENQLLPPIEEAVKEARRLGFFHPNAVLVSADIVLIARTILQLEQGRDYRLLVDPTLNLYKSEPPPIVSSTIFSLIRLADAAGYLREDEGVTPVASNFDRSALPWDTHPSGATPSLSSSGSDRATSRKHASTPPSDDSSVVSTRSSVVNFFGPQRAVCAARLYQEFLRERVSSALGDNTPDITYNVISKASRRFRKLGRWAAAIPEPITHFSLLRDIDNVCLGWSRDDCTCGAEEYQEFGTGITVQEAGDVVSANCNPLTVTMMFGVGHTHPIKPHTHGPQTIASSEMNPLRINLKTGAATIDWSWDSSKDLVPLEQLAMQQRSCKTKNKNRGSRGRGRRIGKIINRRINNGNSEDSTSTPSTTSIVHTLIVNNNPAVSDFVNQSGYAHSSIFSQPAFPSPSHHQPPPQPPPLPHGLPPPSATTLPQRHAQYTPPPLPSPFTAPPSTLPFPLGPTMPHAVPQPFGTPFVPSAPLPTPHPPLPSPHFAQHQLAMQQQLVMAQIQQTQLQMQLQTAAQVQPPRVHHQQPPHLPHHQVNDATRGGAPTTMTDFEERQRVAYAQFLQQELERVRQGGQLPSGQAHPPASSDIAQPNLESLLERLQQ